ncbi:FtsK/SpoIIIE domain-containing protein [Actinomycetospora straminea]|uniref:FtsK domain-containing protein n=1 Tax=Actinomycetospora straminea TaxID=663607 RepID=A0ABP9EM65_9PSEU|nr:FtsK/SpoIIIE domain-containing protein [Actinomycetospora straminea]MDD7936454.1 hypothetical protein [Actinomycetospora straminea]
MPAIEHLRPRPSGHRSGRDRAPGFLGRMRQRRAQRDYEASVLTFAYTLKGEFRDACEYLRVCHYVSVAAGITVRTPRVGEVRVGPPISFTVELMPGQEPEDFRKPGRRMAHTLGAHGLRIEPLAGRWVRLVLLEADPLAEHFGLPPVTAGSGTETVLLGRTEDRTTLGHAIADPAHLAVQGMNGSGKSAFVYGLLAQLCAAPDVLVAGSDITGLLLGRVWDDTAHREWQVVGTHDLEAHAALLEQLVAEMDRRLATIPRREDKITPTVTVPTVLVVLEEFPGLLRAAGAVPKPKSGKSLAERIVSAQLRLLSEGRKAAFRVLTLAQRFEATAVGGGYARDQFALRLSFRVPADSLAMLHGDDARPFGQEHANADPGIAYLSGLGRDCERIRVPHLGDYGEYVDRIQSYGRRAES